jgi:hypothetical protein
LIANGEALFEENLTEAAAEFTRKRAHSSRGDKEFRGSSPDNIDGKSSVEEEGQREQPTKKKKKQKKKSRSRISGERLRAGGKRKHG